MKIFKKIVALATAAVIAVPGVALAQTPIDILLDVATNSADITSVQMIGDIQGAISMDGLQVGELSATMNMLAEVLPDNGSIRIFTDMSGAVSDATMGLQEDFAVRVFMDNYVVLVDLGDGWYNMTNAVYPDGAPDFAGLTELNNLDEMMEWSMEITERFYSILPLAFSSVTQDGYYVIDVVINDGNIAEVVGDFAREFLNVAFFAELTDIFAAHPEVLSIDEFAQINDELDLVLEMLEELEVLINELLNEFGVSFELVYRSFIDSQTRTLSRVGLDLTLGVDLDMGFLGSMSIAGDISGDFDLIYEPAEDQWPVFDINEIPELPFF